MTLRRLSFSERRRRALAMKTDRLDRLESRTTITEPISLTGLAISALRPLAQLGLVQPSGGDIALSGLLAPAAGARLTHEGAQNPIVVRGNLLKPIPDIETPRSAGTPTVGGHLETAQSSSKPATADSANDWLTLSPAPASSDTDAHGISVPWQPAKPAGGGAALPPRGGSSASGPAQSSSRGAITPLILPASTPAASSAGGASAALLAAVAGASGTTTTAAGTSAGAAGSTAAASSVAIVHGSSAAGSSGQRTPPGDGGGDESTPFGDPGPGDSGGALLPGSTPDPVIGNFSEPSMQSFAYFPMYVLDNNTGVVLYPGVDQLATLGGKVDLLAQVSGATVSSYSWDTTNLTGASLTSGTTAYQLTFDWETTNSGGAFESSVTLSVTDTNSHVETFTYDFWVPEGFHASFSGGNATWPTSSAPSQELLSAPAFPSNNASVDATSGSLDTEINLPSYNPNIPGLALTYDSIAANPEPIIVFENTLSASAAVPTKVSAQLTFNSSALTTWYYDSSLLNKGDVQQISLEATNGTALATNRYSYSAQVVDIGTTNVTNTYSGTTTLLNYSGNAFGAGWTLAGLEQIIPETGGVILDLGENGRTLWFAASGSGGSYTAPAGEFSTLSKNVGTGVYTRTMPDGTQITFNSGGYETAVVDLNNQHITFAYVANQLSTITDNYANVTTFGYSGGYLQTIKDPANRTATFTQSGGNLSGVTLPDGSTWGYSYASGGQLTQITDQRSHTTTIVYDSAGRVGTISRPDSTTEKFTNDQESGWTNSGTSGSPAPATLLAQSGSTYTSPNNNATTIQPDWLGMGLAGNVIDPLGNVQLFDRNASGLATVMVDQVNRNTQYAYDSLANITAVTFEDGNTQNYSYDGNSRMLTSQNENGKTTSFTYSSGNLTGVDDALGNLTTMTYTSSGRPSTVKDANSKVTTYLYDSQDRLTTIQFPDGTTNLMSYNSQGNVTKSVDGRNNVTSMSYDALNRQTGTIDALNGLTTLVYDSGGNLTQDQEPTPAGTTARTTQYAYDSINRVTTLTGPLSHATVLGYDSDGNRTTVKDPLNRITTAQYDGLDRPTVVIDPMSGHITTTYDGKGEVINVSDALGRTTTTTFDNRGWVATQTDPLGKTVTFSYTNTGKPSTYTAQTSGGGTSSESYFYDDDERMNVLTDANGNTTTTVFDGVGNKLAVTDANNHTVSYAYDSRNRLTTITDALGHTTVIGYDSGGNQQTVTDGLGHTATTLFDALNRPTTMVNAISSTTTIVYDAGGRETSLTDPVGNKTQWAYDGDDRLTTTTMPNSATVTYVYDNDGELTDTTDADSRRTTYSYDADGDQTGETWVGASPAEKITYTYDADRELTGAADSFATLTFTYDSGGNEITAATSGPGTGQPSVTLTSGYNAQHSLTSVADNVSGNAGLTTFLYDDGQRLTTITTSHNGTAGPQIVTAYAPNNQISSQSRTIAGSGTAVNTTFLYDAADRQTTITDYVSGGAALATYIYTYDNANRVSTEKDTEGTATFSYDNSNEVTTVTGSRTESYAYDANGNRTGTGYSTTVMNEIRTSPGLITYAYDSAGNTISANSGGTFTTYTYDYRNRLTGVKQAGTVIATYVYDAVDRRIEVQEGGSRTWTVYNRTSPDAQPYGDFNGSATLLTRYVSGPGMVNGGVVDELLARTSSGGTSAWYLTDKLDSVRDVVSSSGTVLDHVLYDSFGNIVTQTNVANGDRFKFAEMQYDLVTAQSYDRARYYSQITGRFASVDPDLFDAGDANLYRYVGNMATIAVDPSGRCTLLYFYNLMMLYNAMKMVDLFAIYKRAVQESQRLADNQMESYILTYGLLKDQWRAAKKAEDAAYNDYYANFGLTDQQKYYLIYAHAGAKVIALEIEMMPLEQEFSKYERFRNKMIDLQNDLYGLRMKLRPLANLLNSGGGDG